MSLKFLFCVNSALRAKNHLNKLSQRMFWDMSFTNHAPFATILNGPSSNAGDMHKPGADPGILVGGAWK